MKIDDAYLDAFEADIVRLSRRIYAEVGVPMYLVPEDLTATKARVAPSAQGQEMAALFQDVCAALTIRNGPMDSRDIAHVLEVLADRHFLNQPFSDLSA